MCLVWTLVQIKPQGIHSYCSALTSLWGTTEVSPSLVGHLLPVHTIGRDAPLEKEPLHVRHLKRMTIGCAHVQMGPAAVAVFDLKVLNLKPYSKALMKLAERLPC